MAKVRSLFDAPGFKFENGTLIIKHGGDITLTEDGEGGWTYEQGANTYTISGNEAAMIEAVNIGNGTRLYVSPSIYGDVEFGGRGSVSVTGFDFIEADEAADFKFEPTVNLDTKISEGLASGDVVQIFNELASASSEQDAFKLLWDYLDDNYAYYNESINSDLVDLGIVYANYLLGGGLALTDTIVKYAPDGADAGDNPDRMQSLHDNILGNFDGLSIEDKFSDSSPADIFPDLFDAEDIFARVEDAGLGGLLDRPIYSGNETANPGPTADFDSMFFGI